VENTVDFSGLWTHLAIPKDLVYNLAYGWLPLASITNGNRAFRGWKQFPPTKVWCDLTTILTTKHIMENKKRGQSPANFLAMNRVALSPEGGYFYSAELVYRCGGVPRPVKIHPKETMLLCSVHDTVRKTARKIEDCPAREEGDLHIRIPTVPENRLFLNGNIYLLVDVYFQTHDIIALKQ